MAKKSFRVAYNAKAVITFVLLSVVIMLLDMVAKHKIIPVIFTSPSKASFNFKNVLDYVRLLTHVFSHNAWIPFFVNGIAILLMGPALEERYGTLVLCLMIFASALVTGVLTATLSPEATNGASCIVLMMIILLAINGIIKRNLDFSVIVVCALYLAYLCYTVQKSASAITEGNAFSVFLQKNVPVLIHLAGAIVGSLFAFLPSPAKRGGSSKKAKEESFSADFSEEKPKKKAKAPSWKKQADSESDETVIGTIEL